MSRAYYNEFDPNAAQWIRNLIERGHIAPGDVDERSIEDITPADLVGYTQCHFFAGISIWSAALRDAGWPDSRPVWTGSCPCQPFSSSGKGGGFADERHLWPAWFHLIQHGKPAGVPVFGEQVASDDGLAWLDLVQGDMEASGYTFWPMDLCAAGVGAPHIRQRLFFVAHSQGSECEQPRRTRERRNGLAGSSAPVLVADAHGDELRGGGGRDGDGGEEGGAGEEVRLRPSADVLDGGEAVELVNASNAGLQGRGGLERVRDQEGRQASGRYSASAGAVNGFWEGAEWIPCRDPEVPGAIDWRPTEPGTFPLAPRFTEGVGRGKSSLGGMARRNRNIRIKGYGNSIVKQVATTFIKAFMQQ